MSVTPVTPARAPDYGPSPDCSRNRRHQASPKKRLEIPDGTVTGLYLVVQPSSGAKSWAVRYRHHGRPAKLTLGPYPRLGLADARTSAQETLRLVSEGNDPTADRGHNGEAEAAPAAADNGRTFEAVLDRFIAAQKAKGRRSAEAQKALLDKDATTFWRRRQITSITAADVVERIEAMVGRGAPVNAARFRATVSKLFNYAVKAQLCPDNPARRLKTRLTPNRASASAGSTTANWRWCGMPQASSGILSARRCSYWS